MTIAAIRLPAFACALTLLLSACRSNGALLLFGGDDDPQARLVERVHGAREQVSEVQTEFQTAFELFQRLTAPQAVELEELEDDFEDSFENCQEESEDLDGTLTAIRADSEKLFADWSADLERFSGDALRKKSETMMVETQERSQRVIASLESVQSKMEPVLMQLQDYALFFNHNLNPRAIATLEDTYDDFDAEVKAMRIEIEKAQEEMRSFLLALEGQRAASQ